MCFTIVCINGKISAASPNVFALKVTQVHHYIPSCVLNETGIHTNNFKSVFLFFVKTGLTTVTVKHRIWDIQQSEAFACVHYLHTHSCQV